MSTGTILVADRESWRSARCRRQLEAEGYHVTCVSGREQLLKRLRDEPPDLVVLDLQLGGLETLCDVSQAAPHMPVILTSPFEAPCIDDFRTWLADAVVVRSSDLTELMDAVRRLMARTEAPRPARHSCPAGQ